MTQRDTASDPETGRGSDREAYTARYEWGGTDRPSMAIVRSVAAVTGREPTAMRPLFDAIDPEAVDRLFGRDSARARPDRLSVRFEDCEVAVHADGRIVVTSLE